MDRERPGVRWYVWSPLGAASADSLLVVSRTGYHEENKKFEACSFIDWFE